MKYPHIFYLFILQCFHITIKRPITENLTVNFFLMGYLVTSRDYVPSSYSYITTELAIAKKCKTTSSRTRYNSQSRTLMLHT